MRLHPPTLQEIRQNLQLFTSDWQRAGLAMRYYVVTHLLAHFVMLGASAASLVAMIAGEQALQIGLLAAAAAAAVQSVLTWGVLQKRFKVRYELI